jgi:Sugar (and other) transporter
MLRVTAGSCRAHIRFQAAWRSSSVHLDRLGSPGLCSFRRRSKKAAGCGNVSIDVAWRVLLALGAVRAAAVIYLRCRMPESPRYQAQVQGRAGQAASGIPGLAGGQVNGNGSG